jgi:hypothetical protein
MDPASSVVRLPENNLQESQVGTSEDDTIVTGCLYHVPANLSQLQKSRGI